VQTLNTGIIILNNLGHYIKDMAADIVTLTQEILELFTKNDLTRPQSIFVLKSVEMQIQENIIKDSIEESRKGNDNTSAGIA